MNWSWSDFLSMRGYGLYGTHTAVDEVAERYEEVVDLVLRIVSQEMKLKRLGEEMLQAARLIVPDAPRFFAVGIDGNQPTLDLLQQGKFSATLGVDPPRMGETVFDTLQKVLAGETVPEDYHARRRTVNRAPRRRRPNGRARSCARDGAPRARSRRTSPWK